MSLFDSVEDAREILDEYISKHRCMRKGCVAQQAVQAVCDTLRAVAVYESSPFPISTHVDDAVGAAHLKKVLTPSEHSAWLALVDKVSPSEREAQRKRKTAS
jgi:hypothetical protein